MALTSLREIRFERRLGVRPFVQTLWGLSLVALSVVLASAQEKVNFSGTWVLDKSQSDVSQLMGLSDDAEKVRNAGMTMVVDQHGSNLRVNRTLRTQSGERKEIHIYKIGGGQTTNTGARGETVVGRAFWEGDKLVIVSTRTWRVLLKDVSTESRGVWSLSPDGKSLTITAEVRGPHGDHRGKVVFDKQ
jgi:hypothetical protein